MQSWVNLGEGLEVGIVQLEKRSFGVKLISQDFKGGDKKHGERLDKGRTRGTGRVRWNIGKKFFL